MDKKTFSIGILSVTALLLVVANLLVPTLPTAYGDVIKDRDYQAVTASMSRGGDALYVIDNRTGNIGVFAYNANRKAIESVDVQQVTEAFPARQ